MPQALQLLVFSLDEQRYALHLAAVDRIVRAVEITPLPGAPDGVLGVISVRGQVVPVMNVRRRFGLPEREVELSDRLILARTARRPAALVADSVPGLAEVPTADWAAAQALVPGARYVQGIVRFEDGLVLIHDLAHFLWPNEEMALDEALAAR